MSDLSLPGSWSHASVHAVMWATSTTTRAAVSSHLTPDLLFTGPSR